VVQDSEVKAELKKHFQQIYQKMKDVNTKLEKVDWND
jgi:hypothetical protein